jgi:hypothetical protein
MKLTKSALNKFITWSTSRYNDYLGFGTKKYNINEVYNSLKAGHRVSGTGKNPQPGVTKFTIECSAGNGESYNGNFRYWRLKGRKGDYRYEIDCIEKSVTGIPSMNKITFKT